MSLTKNQKLVADVLKRQVRVVGTIDAEYNRNCNQLVTNIAIEFAYEFFGDKVRQTVDQDKVNNFVKACGL